MRSSGGARQISSPTVNTITTKKNTLSCLNETLELTASIRALFSEQHHTIATNSTAHPENDGKRLHLQRAPLFRPSAAFGTDGSVYPFYFSHVTASSKQLWDWSKSSWRSWARTSPLSRCATPAGSIDSGTVDWQRTDLWVSLTLHCLADGGQSHWKLTCPIWLGTMNKRRRCVKFDFSASHVICDHIFGLTAAKCGQSDKPSLSLTEWCSLNSGR